MADQPVNRTVLRSDQKPSPWTLRSLSGAISGLMIIGWGVLLGVHLHLDGARASQGSATVDGFHHGPGVLAAAAPADARQVELRLPSGRAIPMQYNQAHSHWHASVKPSQAAPWEPQNIGVRMVLADGTTRWRYGDYQAQDAGFDLDVDEVVVAGEAVALLVDPMLRLSDVTVHFARLAAGPVALEMDPETGLYLLELAVPDDFDGRDFEVRVVARDAGGNAFEQHRVVEVIPAIECCHEDPGDDC